MNRWQDQVRAWQRLRLIGETSPLRCAGLNRLEVEDESSLRERSSDPLGLESCAATAFRRREVNMCVVALIDSGVFQDFAFRADISVLLRHVGELVDAIEISRLPAQRRNKILSQTNTSKVDAKPARRRDRPCGACCSVALHS